jgi:hypothetical protein
MADRDLAPMLRDGRCAVCGHADCDVTTHLRTGEAVVVIDGETGTQTIVPTTSLPATADVTELTPGRRYTVVRGANYRAR